ncbi:unnamed protein product [Rotaria sp. Silwood2]|nr:unnamed protein product [Rotaria sp. Silwood2]CAF3025598.1 unnamed protein product [Rotaria sp. Silwood2]CAF4221081.1 unnamed protein product [Rotaria sp. Silwood2]CAF4316541.1 unnamed protein product [Rotaria sp. Silwood2]CAF4321374.1 unnamed protein product [Rotaria sp. Silwood2]
MSGLRKSSRIRKPITTIDQNLEDEEDEQVFITPKSKKITQSIASTKRSSTDDYDEQETIIPKKRQKKKSSTTTTKTSPYFNKKPTGKKSTAKSKGKNKTEKPNNQSIDENATLSNNTTNLTTKPTTISDENDTDSDDDDDDDDAWENVHSKPNEEVAIQKLLKEREEKQSIKIDDEVEVNLTSDEVAATQGKRKKNLNSKEHQLELQLKRVLKKNFLQKHKHHIVCNLGHGFHLIKTYINNQELRSLMFSLLDESITKTLIYNSKTTNMNDIHRLVKYFNDIFILIDKPSNDIQENQPITMEKLRQAMSVHLTNTLSSIRVILFAIYVRLLQYECRLVFSADLPPIRPRQEKDEKFHIPHGSLTKNIKKKQPTLSDDDDDNSNSTINEDTSRLHSHDHSSDLSRVISSNSSEIVKNDQAISPESTTTDSKQLKSKIKTRSLKPRYYWIELFIESIDDGYMPIDIYTSKINSITEFEINIKFPMLYVWAFDTDLSSSYAKDVTKRYSKKWLTTSYRTSHIEHKTNGDSKWYEKLMRKYQPKDKRKSTYSQVENKQIENQLARQPIPQSKSELNGHPLYVLKSKLLKFEGIYPNDTQPIGWFKDEPIYSRDNIHILRSKQTWLKEARQVNQGEEPYKIVEGRIKNMNRKMGVTIRPELELFGEWQTSEYIPPVATDGIVPCNEYGNVDLFKPEMLPHGCVHIVESNASRLCKKLGINYAEAITGFDAHGGGSHPVIEGIVICKEYEQTLRDALEQQKQITIEKEIKKKEDRVYKNWRKLIRGLIIKQNLAKKYADDDIDGTEMATDAKYQWPVLPKEDNDNDEDSM